MNTTQVHMYFLVAHEFRVRLHANTLALALEAGSTTVHAPAETCDLSFLRSEAQPALVAAPSCIHTYSYTLLQQSCLSARPYSQDVCSSC